MRDINFILKAQVMIIWFMTPRWVTVTVEWALLCMHYQTRTRRDMWKRTQYCGFIQERCPVPFDKLSRLATADKCKKQALRCARSMKRMVTNARRRPTGIRRSFSNSITCNYRDTEGKCSPRRLIRLKLYTWLRDKAEGPAKHFHSL